LGTRNWAVSNGIQGKLCTLAPLRLCEKQKDVASVAPLREKGIGYWERGIGRFQGAFRKNFAPWPLGAFAFSMIQKNIFNIWLPSAYAQFRSYFSTKSRSSLRTACIRKTSLFLTALITLILFLPCSTFRS